MTIDCGGLTHLFILFFNVITNTPEKRSGEKKTSLRLVHTPKVDPSPMSKTIYLPDDAKLKVTKYTIY